MLLGQHRVKVAATNRTALPKKFREELGDKLIVAQGYENCLIIVSEKQWKDLTGEIEAKPFLLGEARDTTRFLFGNAEVLELDFQGRFFLPEFLRVYAQIGEEAVFLGLGRYLEVWDGKNWEKYQKYLAEKSGEIAKRLSDGKKGDE